MNTILSVGEVFDDGIAGATIDTEGVMPLFTPHAVFATTTN